MQGAHEDIQGGHLSGPLMPPGPVGVRTGTISQAVMLAMTCKRANPGADTPERPEHFLPLLAHRIYK